jgi:hypothetical protein
VRALEDVLQVYARPLDPARPVICLDEGGKALHREVRPPQAARPGQARREDSTYARNGMVSLFLACAPQLGWRQVWSSDQRASVDFAAVVRRLVDECFPQAATIVLVLDNLNTHRPAALYAAFPPAEALRILNRLEWHYTPKHASWLNMAELELSALQRQCIADRIPDRATLDARLDAWTAERNQAPVPIHWRYTIEDARRTMRHVYPIPQQDI